jgi:hypothetical protein
MLVLRGHRRLLCLQKAVIEQVLVLICCQKLVYAAPQLLVSTLILLLHEVVDAHTDAVDFGRVLKRRPIEEA